MLMGMSVIRSVGMYIPINLDFCDIYVSDSVWDAQ